MSVIGRCIFLIRSQKVTQACRPNSFPIRAPLTATSDVPTLTRPCANNMVWWQTSKARIREEHVDDDALRGAVEQALQGSPRPQI